MLILSSSFFVFGRKMGNSDFPELRKSLLDLNHSANYFNSVYYGFNCG